MDTLAVKAGDIIIIGRKDPVTPASPASLSIIDASEELDGWMHVPISACDIDVDESGVIHIRI